MSNAKTHERKPKSKQQANKQNNKRTNMGCTTSSPVTTTTTTNNGDSSSKQTQQVKYPIVGSKDIMKRKKHGGTSTVPLQQDLKWNCDRKEVDKICNYNRHYAEYSNSFSKNKLFKQEFQKCQRQNIAMKFYDSNSGKLLFEAPRGRSHEEFWNESKKHGWPSFRDDEVNWKEVRCLPNGESVSLNGTHLVS